MSRRGPRPPPRVRTRKPRPPGGQAASRSSPSFFSKASSAASSWWTRATSSSPVPREDKAASVDSPLASAAAAPPPGFVPFVAPVFPHPFHERRVATLPTYRGPEEDLQELRLLGLVSDPLGRRGEDQDEEEEVVEERARRERRLASAWRTWWLMDTLLKSMQHGAHVSPRLFVAREVWHRENARIVALSTKVEVCQQLEKLLRGLQSTVQFHDGHEEGVLARLQRFVRALEELQDSLAFQVSCVDEMQVAREKETRQLAGEVVAAPPSPEASPAPSPGGSPVHSEPSSPRGHGAHGLLPPDQLHVPPRAPSAPPSSRAADESGSSSRLSGWKAKVKSFGYNVAKSAVRLGRSALSHAGVSMEENEAYIAELERVLQYTVFLRGLYQRFYANAEIVATLHEVALFFRTAFCAFVMEDLTRYVERTWKQEAPSLEKLEP